MPFKLDSEWTLVVRTILPVISQNDIFPGAGEQFGLGDTLQSFFFVPQTVNGFTWGVGPAVLWRTGTETLLSSGNGQQAQPPWRSNKLVLGPLELS